MYDIKNLNIWKKKENPNRNKEYLKADITELNLSVRSYNCLKRAGCNTIRDVLSLLDEEGSGLRNIRNLGSRSEEEILNAIKQHRDYSAQLVDALNPQEQDLEDVDVLIIRRKQVRSELGLWETDIEAFDLSDYALSRLKESCISKVKDLYATNPKNEPGWYAVRELFEKIHAV